MIRAFVSVALVLATGAAGAQTRPLTIDDLYDPQRKIDFSGGAPTGFSWISDTHYAWPQPAKDGQVEWLKVEAATGKSEPLVDAPKMRAAFAALPGLRPEDVARLPNDRGLEMNAARNAAIVSIGDDLYYYPFGTDRAFRLTFDPHAEEEFSFSPDGRLAAFVRRNNLFVVNLEQQRQEKQLTTSGTDQLLNGKLDWVYQEEIYGRGNFRAYWWSHDSSHLAFLQVDDRPVPEFTVVDHIPTRLTVEAWDYPKAGDPNPIVKLGVIPVVGGHVQWVDLSKYSAAEFLIVNVAWTPDSSRVVYQVQNREQVPGSISMSCRRQVRNRRRSFVKPRRPGSTSTARRSGSKTDRCCGRAIGPDGSICIAIRLTARSLVLSHVESGTSGSSTVSMNPAGGCTLPPRNAATSRPICTA